MGATSQSLCAWQFSAWRFCHTSPSPLLCLVWLAFFSQRSRAHSIACVAPFHSSTFRFHFLLWLCAERFRPCLLIFLFSLQFLVSFCHHRRCCCVMMVMVVVVLCSCRALISAHLVRSGCMHDTRFSILLHIKRVLNRWNTHDYGYVFRWKGHKRKFKLAHRMYTHRTRQPQWIQCGGNCMAFVHICPTLNMVAMTFAPLQRFVAMRIITSIFFHIHFDRWACSLFAHQMDVGFGFSCTAFQIEFVQSLKSIYISSCKSTYEKSEWYSKLYIKMNFPKITWMWWILLILPNILWLQC